MENLLRFRAVLDDKVSGGLDKIGVKSAKLQGTNKVSALGLTLMGGAAITAGAALFGLASKAADEEVNVAKLGASLRANVPNWDGNTAAIERTIAAREDLAFSDDELRNSLALLLPSTKNVTKAWELQSTAMDLARFKGISLEEASTALIKIEGGQFRALKALIGSTKDITTSEQALAAVRKVAAGQADAYAQTTRGKLDRLAIGWEDLQESAGQAVLNIADGWKTILDVTTDESAKKAVNSLHADMDGLRDAAKQDAMIIGSEWSHQLGPEGDAVIAAKEFGQFMATSIRSSNDDVLSASDDLLVEMKKPFLSKEKLQDILEGKGSLGKRLKAGLNSERPNVVDAAEKMRDELIAALDVLIGIDVIPFAGTKSTARRGSRGETKPPPRGKGGQNQGIGHAEGGWIGLDGPEFGVFGEQGPEYVVPNNQLGALMGGGGGHSHNIYMDGHLVARAVSERHYGDYSRGSPSATRK